MDSPTKHEGKRGGVKCRRLLFDVSNMNELALFSVIFMLTRMGLEFLLFESSLCQSSVDYDKVQ